jgi:chromosome partitioning protein
MRIVSFLGKKGGVGKTTNAHATAHGLSMVGIPAAYIMTDDRELLSDEKRVYSIIDGRSVAKLERAVTTAKQHGGGNGIMVIDGGGNRVVVDDLIASISNLVVLPFTADDDSVYVVATDLGRFPKAFALPTNWPTNSKAATIDAGYIEKLEAQFPGRILPSVPTTHAIRDFVLSEFNGALLPPAQRYCRAVARQIASLLDDVDEQAEEAQQPEKVA